MSHSVLHPKALQGTACAAVAAAGLPHSASYTQLLYKSSTVNYVKYSLWYTAATKQACMQHLLNHPRPETCKGAFAAAQEPDRHSLRWWLKDTMKQTGQSPAVKVRQLDAPTASRPTPGKPQHIAPATTHAQPATSACHNVCAVQHTAVPCPTATSIPTAPQPHTRGMLS